MPLPEYVYAVMHDGNKNFLMFKKNTMGYFYKGRATQSSGIRIPHGGGKCALPGGGVDEYPKIPVEEDGQGNPKCQKERISKEAIREFREETAAGISGLQCVCRGWKHYGRKRCYYYGVYFLCTPEQLIDGHAAVAKTLEVGAIASQSVKNGAIPEGRIIAEHHCPAPLDNELCSVEKWNFTEKRSLIRSWRTDNDLSWFTVILENLP
ncbi:NUDIX hydrolase [Streptomyces sp. NPDC037389]|uniref:NUDIX hydrolase n=1 Tax=Streptomyces sp. NPDC037389 TaxID=3155369 RepID=UPI0033F9E36D